MPFSPTPPASEPVPEPGVGARKPAPGAEVAALADNADDWQQEKQVRLTAQRVLSAHLIEAPPGKEVPANRVSDRFWPGIRLDLTGATLIDFSLNSAVLADAQFDSATFAGRAEFNLATFAVGVDFNRATFNGPVRFERATFNDDLTWFGGVTFDDEARFSNATFNSAWFVKGTFKGQAFFSSAAFNGTAWFEEATFKGTAQFGEALFGRGAQFSKATFHGTVLFGLATFPNWLGVSFVGSHVLSPNAQHTWPKGWHIGETGDGAHTVLHADSSASS